MTIEQIADKLAEYCKNSEFEAAQDEFYTEETVSIEPDDSPGFDKETKGLKKIKEKGEKFMGMVEESFGTTVSKPLIAGNSFTFILEMDMKMKGQERNKMKELCVYTVKDDKIISEQFFW